jgi:CBS domain containing-hemolysin-like protein
MDGSEANPDTYAIAWRLGAVLLLVLVNGFFVAAEFALVTVRGSRVDALAATGRRSAQVARHLLDHIDRYLSACQLGITMASLGLGWLGEPAVATLLRSAAHRLGWGVAAGSPLLHGVAFALAFAFITTLHMTLGEQAPKIWALKRAEKTTLQISVPLRIFAILFNPFVIVINGISNALLLLVGIKVTELGEPPHTAEELRAVLTTSASAGHISRRQLEFAKNILGIVELEVRHILVPRVDVVYLSLNTPLEENLRVLRESGHSRFPVCRGGLDTVIGFVHAKDVLGALTDGKTPDLRRLARRPVFVSDTQPVSRLIAQLQKARSHSAVVVDEHGTAIGLAFLEDAIEEIVGPIRDEFDEQPPDVRQLSTGVLEVPGSLSLPDAEDRLELELEEGHADTIGGHVVEVLGCLPHKGDKLQLGPYRVTVLEVTRRRISSLRFEKIEPEAETSGRST